MITILLSHISYPGVTIDLYGDPHGRSFGLFFPGSNKIMRMHACRQMKEDVKIWRLIQRERKRLKLPPLKDEEMIV